MQFRCPATVYPPSEDSYLLAGSVKGAKGKSAIDVGCGNGIQSLNLLFLGAAKVIALDINEYALRATEMNCKAAGFGNKIDARKSDLFSACPEKADIIVFNPPYIETSQEEVDASGKKYRFADLDGGKRGREILDRFLHEMPTHLNKGGMCYFLQTGLNGYAQTEKILKRLGLGFEIAGRKKIFFEELAVYRCWKANNAKN